MPSLCFFLGLFLGLPGSGEVLRVLAGRILCDSGHDRLRQRTISYRQSRPQILSPSRKFPRSGMRAVLGLIRRGDGFDSR